MKLFTQIGLASLVSLAAFPMTGWAQTAIPSRATEVRRVVSINLCTDQLLLLVGKPDQIISLSFLAQNADISVMVDKARNYPVNHGLAEEILPLQPDMVLAGRYTSRYTVALLKEQGFNILVLDPARGVQDIIANLRAVGKAIGRSGFAEKLIRKIRTEKNYPQAPERVILYGASGSTAGYPSLGDAAVSKAGYVNIATELGIGSWGYLGIEGLLRSNPDLIVFQRSGKSIPSMARQLLDHPALTNSNLPSRRMDLGKSELICGTPALFSAVRAIRNRLVKEQLQ